LPPSFFTLTALIPLIPIWVCFILYCFTHYMSMSFSRPCVYSRFLFSACWEPCLGARGAASCERCVCLVDLHSCFAFLNCLIIYQILFIKIGQVRGRVDHGTRWPKRLRVDNETRWLEIWYRRTDTKFWILAQSILTEKAWQPLICKSEHKFSALPFNLRIRT
jgi:hypothetical protein